MCMNTNVYLFETVLFLSTESVLAVLTFLLYVSKTSLHGHLMEAYEWIFFVCIFYMS